MPMLEWAGKKKVVNHHNEVPFHTLVRKWGFGENSHTEAQRHGGGEAERVDGAADGGLPQKLRDSVSPCDENMIIHGDNLLALKSLLPRYEGKVKCIYIDPPYNTGNEGWVYNDNVNDPQIKAWLNKVVGKEGEDFTRHDKWLCMMYPRLMLLRKLLSEDGAIFISIDDNEQANLKLLCDEVFGGRNFVANIAVVNNLKGRSDDKYIATSHEGLLIYHGGKFATFGVEMPVEYDREYRLKDCHGRYRLQGLRKRGDSARREDRPNMFYPFYYNPITDTLSLEQTNGCVEILPHLSDGSDGRWRWGKETAKERVGELTVQSVKGRGEYDVFQKDYLPNDSKRRIKPKSVWMGPEFAKETGTLEVKSILGKGVFDTPKPVGLLSYILQQACDKDSIILDSFAGSGTTAHAVLNANKQDGGNRKFILVEMMDYAESVTAERVKRVIRGYGHTEARRHGGGSASQDLRDSVAPCETTNATGGSFGYYELGPELMRDGVLNEETGAEAIREYVWYTETRGAGKFSHTEAQRHGEGEAGRVFGAADGGASQQLRDSVAPCEEYLLGTAFGVAYYFCYEKGEVVTLNRALLKKIKTKAESYVVYADICTLSAAELEKYHITFKKIPRDITRF